MPDASPSQSLILKALDEIGFGGDKLHDIENLIPVALADTTSIDLKKCIALIFAVRLLPDRDDAATTMRIIDSIAKSDAAAAFVALFAVRNASVELMHSRGDSIESGIVYQHALPLLPRLRDSDLPICAALVFDAVQHGRDDENPKLLIQLSQAMVERLAQSNPVELKSIYEFLIADDPENPFIAHAFSQHLTGAPRPRRIRTPTDPTPRPET